jgi:uncharacterized paraquat-inducible protein A
MRTRWAARVAQFRALGHNTTQMRKSIRVTCPHCNEEYRFRPENIGTTGECNRCGKSFTATQQAEYTTDEIREIAKRQKHLIWLVLINLLTCGIAGIIAPFFIYKVAVSLKLKVPWLYAVLVVVPLVGMIVLLGLNGHATGALKTQGIRVGLFGADHRAIEKLPKHVA